MTWFIQIIPQITLLNYKRISKIIVTWMFHICYNYYFCVGLKCVFWAIQYALWMVHRTPLYNQVVHDWSTYLQNWSGLPIYRTGISFHCFVLLQKLIIVIGFLSWYIVVHTYWLLGAQPLARIVIHIISSGRLSTDYYSFNWLVFSNDL